MMCIANSLISRLHQSEEFSDCKLICGPYHFNLHKVILASQTDYFKAAFRQGAFKVMPPPTTARRTLTDSEQEGETGVLELKAAPSDGETSVEDCEVYDEPEIVKLMVEYFYHFDYLRDTELLARPAARPKPAARTAKNPFATKKLKREDVRVCLPPPAMESHQSELPSQGYIVEPAQVFSQGYIIEHAKVFALAVKYQIDGLRGLAASKFKDAATAYWKHNDFVDAIYLAYDSTPEEVTGLREVVLDILHQHFDELEGEENFETAFYNIPGLAYALLKRSHAESRNGGMRLGEQSQSLATDDKRLDAWKRSAQQNSARYKNSRAQESRPTPW
jgi:hypothetical protein